MQLSKFGWLALVATVGACGGSSGSDQQQDPQTLIRSACDKVVSLQCGVPNPEQCPADMEQARTEAASKGCGAAFDVIMVCYAQRLTSCSQQPRDVCKPEFDALDACEKNAGGDECSQGFGGAPPGSVPGFQQCDVMCPTWRAHCETDASATLVCSCTEGPRSGTPFNATSCKEMSIALSAQHCQG